MLPCFPCPAGLLKAHAKACKQLASTLQQLEQPQAPTQQGQQQQQQQQVAVGLQSNLKVAQRIISISTGIFRYWFTVGDTSLNPLQVLAHKDFSPALVATAELAVAAMQTPDPASQQLVPPPAQLPPPAAAGARAATAAAADAARPATSSSSSSSSHNGVAVSDNGEIGTVVTYTVDGDTVEFPDFGKTDVLTMIGYITNSFLLAVSYAEPEILLLARVPDGQVPVPAPPGTAAALAAKYPTIAANANAAASSLKKTLFSHAVMRMLCFRFACIAKLMYDYRKGRSPVPVPAALVVAKGKPTARQPQGHSQASSSSRTSGAAAAVVVEGAEAVGGRQRTTATAAGAAAAAGGHIQVPPYHEQLFAAVGIPEAATSTHFFGGALKQQMLERGGLELILHPFAQIWRARIAAMSSGSSSSRGSGSGSRGEAAGGSSSSSVVHRMGSSPASEPMDEFVIPTELCLPTALMLLEAMLLQPEVRLLSKGVVWMTQLIRVYHISQRHKQMVTRDEAYAASMDGAETGEEVAMTLDSLVKPLLLLFSPAVLHVGQKGKGNTAPAEARAAGGSGAGGVDLPADGAYLFASLQGDADMQTLLDVWSYLLCNMCDDGKCLASVAGVRRTVGPFAWA